MVLKNIKNHFLSCKLIAVFVAAAIIIVFSCHVIQLFSKNYLLHIINTISVGTY